MPAPPSFRGDSTYGTFQGTVDHDENGIIVNGRHIAVTRCKAGEWEWERLGVSLAVGNHQHHQEHEGLAWHPFARAVVISAPGKDVDAMIVMGVNHNIYDGAKHNVISAARTTNCLAPAVKVLHYDLGFRHGLMTTIHSYTMSRASGRHPQGSRPRRLPACPWFPPARAASRGHVMPELAGKLTW